MPGDRPANPLAGEVALALGSQRFLFRPSFARILAAEAEIGSLLDLAMRAGEGRVAIKEIASLLWFCLEPGEGDKPTLQAFGDRILAAGIGQVTPAFRDLLTVILGGDADPVDA